MIIADETKTSDYARIHRREGGDKRRLSRPGYWSTLRPKDSLGTRGGVLKLQCGSRCPDLLSLIDVDTIRGQ